MKHQLPWRLEAARGGVNVVNASGEQVALFEDETDARAVVEWMNRQWLVQQSWFRAAVRSALAGGPSHGPH